MNTAKLLFATIAMLLLKSVAMAQIPVETFAGDAKATIDIMFFKFIKDSNEANTPWLFFNRNRASVDYRMTETEYLPQFGFTEAFSYNHPALKGFAPVAVAQVFGSGVYPKGGIQYARVTSNFTLFSWFVAETREDPSLDLFLLLRYTPQLNERWDLFLQGETLNTMPTLDTAPYAFTQRVRIGLQIQHLQFGAGVDLNQSGVSEFTQTSNIGAFIRHEF